VNNFKYLFAKKDFKIYRLSIDKGLLQDNMLSEKYGDY